MLVSYIEERAESLLREFNLYRLPVDVIKCADLLGIDVLAVELEPEISGVFIKKENMPYIRYNSKDMPARQRFTIAHEIGHFLLHSRSQSLFIEKLEKVMYRNMESSTGELLKEREANAFAAALLMPKRLVEETVAELSENEFEDFIHSLAVRFKVSDNAMGIRLSNMGLLEHGHF